MVLYLNGLRQLLEGYLDLLGVVDDFIEGQCRESSGLGCEMDVIEVYLSVVNKVLESGISELEMPEKERESETNS